MHKQGNRQVDHMTLKFAGTTWIDSAAEGTDENRWTNFPWEWPAAFIRDDQALEIMTSHLYWKAENINVTFKNMICVQDLGTTTAGLVATGSNLQAQFFSYLDNNWTRGLPATPRTMGYTVASFNNIIDSWDSSGYRNGAPIIMPTTNIDVNSFTSSYPDVKNCGMGPGQKLQHGWRMNNRYWRLSSELLGFLFTDTGAICPRWDELTGFLGTSVVAGAGAITNNAPQSRNAFQRGTEIPISAVQQSLQWHRTDEPIPTLWIQLQPQLASLAAGIGQSRAQVQFEMSVDLAMTGRVPRIGTQTGFAASTISGSAYRFSGPAGAMNHLPVFYPASCTAG